MDGRIDWLRRGERRWSAELAFRAAGLLLLAASAKVAQAIYRLVSAPSPHPASPREFAGCLAALVLLICGLALAGEGPGLFCHVPIPRKSAYF